MPEEAKVVRRIYKDFLLGKTYAEIALALTADKIPTPKGRVVWSRSTVKSILTNEKCMGDALCTTPHLTDDQIKTAFIKMANALILEKTEVLELCGAIIAEVLGTKDLEEKLAKLELEAEESDDE